MDLVESLKKIAFDNGLDLNEFTLTEEEMVGRMYGSLMLVFPAIGKISPILISADEGETWTPEASGPQAMMWSGMICLRGDELAKEIRSMHEGLKLGAPDRMLKVAKELMSINDNIIYS